MPNRKKSISSKRHSAKFWTSRNKERLVLWSLLLWLLRNDLSDLFCWLFDFLGLHEFLSWARLLIEFVGTLRGLVKR